MGGEGCFCKIQAASRIPVMISTALRQTKRKVLARRPREQSRLNQESKSDQAFRSVTPGGPKLGLLSSRGNFHLHLQTGGTPYWKLWAPSRSWASPGNEGSFSFLTLLRPRV